MEKKYQNIICAVDTDNLRIASNLTCYIRQKVAAVKVGLEFFTANGPQGVREIMKYQVPIFLDLKFHDIPNTVEKAIRAAVNLGVFMITVHTLGGEKMLKAAKEAAMDEAGKTGRPAPMILGVTILTSMDDKDVKKIGIKRNIDKQVYFLAEQAWKSGLDGVVCSSHELVALKKEFGSELKFVTPGIRLRDEATDDQKRVMTPGEAVKKGADYIVVGRPITKSSAPLDVIEKIASEIERTKY